MRSRAVILAAAIVMAPLGARAADLVVWWEEGYNAEEDAAVKEIIAAFEQETGKQVELVFYPMVELPEKIKAALEAGQPPDFAFGFWVADHIAEWAFDDRLVDLSDTVGHFSDLFDPDALDRCHAAQCNDRPEGAVRPADGQLTHLIHVWKSLLEQAGFTLEDIPREWDAYWSFWCDQVQPAVRRATGRDDIWGVGLPMSVEAADTQNARPVHGCLRGGLRDARRPARDRRAGGPAEAHQGDRQLHGDLSEGLHPAQFGHLGRYRQQRAVPGSGGRDDAEQLPLDTQRAQARAPRRLLQEHCHDRMATRPLGRGFPAHHRHPFGMVFSDGGNIATAKEFVRFLVGEGWLAHYLDFSGERMLPSMPGLLEQPFWLDPSDPHRMAAVMQAASRPTQYEYTAVSGDLGHELVWQERVWAKAVHRVAADGITPEQAVDEAIARIKQILSE